MISTVKAPLSVLLFSFKPLFLSLKEVEAQRCVSKGSCKYCPPNLKLKRVAASVLGTYLSPSVGVYPI